MKKGTAPLVIGIIILVCLVAALNIWQSRTASSSDDDQQQSQQQSQQQTSPKSGQNPGADPADKPVTPLTGDLVSTLVPEETIGDPAHAKTRVTIGYTFDTNTQADPSKAAAIVGAVQDWARKQGSAASLQVICVDLPPDQFSNTADKSVPLGITINGKQPADLAANPGEGSYSVSSVLKALGGP